MTAGVNRVLWNPEWLLWKVKSQLDRGEWPRNSQHPAVTSANIFMEVWDLLATAKHVSRISYLTNIPPRLFIACWQRQGTQADAEPTRDLLATGDNVGRISYLTNIPFQLFINYLGTQADAEPTRDLLATADDSNLRGTQADGEPTRDLLATADDIGRISYLTNIPFQLFINYL
ncbi:hypothetical protein J6590_062674 [Homalodisca vitripennis]|nr:hypothetical protein J6590_062674 [Homalodisca vitripennis]